MLEKLKNLAFVQRTILRLKNTYALNSKTTWYDFLIGMGKKIVDNDTSERASSAAFNLILAIFPSFIFLFTLIPYIPIENLEKEIFVFLAEVIPAPTFKVVDTTIHDIISRPRGGVLSFGFLFALFAATNGVMALMNAFNSSHKIVEHRSFLKRRLVALGLTFTLTFALFLAITVLVVGGVVTSYLQQLGILSDILTRTVTLGRYLVVFGVFVGVVAVMYRYGPDVNMKWRLITPGCVTASVLIVLTTYIFSYYVSNFSSYNKVYGSIGTLIALMIWINLVSLILIIGFEINDCLYKLEGERDPIVEEKIIQPEEPAGVTTTT
ncbi:YihY/virulence factor BrkB family protein [Nibrella saemangeumensis]|uniref:YihY/virulence factor BrkB family protein n=1 Tax=Nibrella saemangeumensis TaxID=1084526 RepID=A0ABP8NSQ9_9BACT